MKEGFFGYVCREKLGCFLIYWVWVVLSATPKSFSSHISQKRAERERTREVLEYMESCWNTYSEERQREQTFKECSIPGDLHACSAQSPDWKHIYFPLTRI